MEQGKNENKKEEEEVGKRRNTSTERKEWKKNETSTTIRNDLSLMIEIAFVVRFFDSIHLRAYCVYLL